MCHLTVNGTFEQAGRTFRGDLSLAFLISILGLGQLGDVVGPCQLGKPTAHCILLQEVHGLSSSFLSLGWSYRPLSRD